MDRGYYKNSLAASEQALVASPGDVDAVKLQTTAKGRAAVQDAKDQAGQGDYIAAGKTLQMAFQLLPDNQEAKTLQGDYKGQEAAQIAKQEHTRDVFDRLCMSNSVSSLFEEHEISVANRTPEEMRDALVQSCMEFPQMKVVLNRSPEMGIIELGLTQASDSPLITARRKCLMVIGTGKDNQTVVLFKMLEFQRRANGLADYALNVNNPNEWIPLHSSRIQMTPAYEEQIRVGMRMMMNKIVQPVDREKEKGRKPDEPEP